VSEREFSRGIPRAVVLRLRSDGGQRMTKAGGRVRWAADESREGMAGRLTRHDFIGLITFHVNFPRFRHVYSCTQLAGSHLCNILRTIVPTISFAILPAIRCYFTCYLMRYSIYYYIDFSLDLIGFRRSKFLLGRGIIKSQWMLRARMLLG
jgi:hypothetical protein